ncbi:MAG: hypothetical protein WDO18_00105 [Acidobacteriota bacterium]
MTALRACSALLAVTSLTMLTACSHEFDPAEVIEQSKFSLRGEQVSVTPDQVLCGEKAGLWKVEQFSNGGAAARLTAEARALGFADDVMMGESSHPESPYAQVSGVLSLKVDKVSSVVDENPATKLVTARVGVGVQHECFGAPLPLDGVDRGMFTSTVEPSFRLRGPNWVVDQIVH